LLVAFDAYVEAKGFQHLAYSDIEETYRRKIFLVDPAMQTKTGSTIIWIR
jgi:hypothetical protein